MFKVSTVNRNVSGHITNICEKGLYSFITSHNVNEIACGFVSLFVYGQMCFIYIVSLYGICSFLVYFYGWKQKRDLGLSRKHKAFYNVFI